MAKENRCGWVGDSDKLMEIYHDTEWGKPVTDDNTLFEFLTLEFFQAGLSWKTILHKRENFRKAFKNFDAQKIAAFTDADIALLMQDAGIIRNRLKILAAINNAQLFLSTQKEFGSFAKYIWQFTDYTIIQNHFESLSQIPATTAVSDSMAKDLKKRGFKFMGSTVCYAHMQATGMTNDHVINCPCYKKYAKNSVVRL